MMLRKRKQSIISSLASEKQEGSSFSDVFFRRPREGRERMNMRFAFLFSVL